MFKKVYVTTKVKFLLSIVVAFIWMVFSIWIAQPWMETLADGIRYLLADIFIDDIAIKSGYVLSYLIVCGIAIIPGFMNMFLISSLLLDRRPPRKTFTDEDIPETTVLMAAYNEEDSMEDTIISLSQQSLIQSGKVNVWVINDGSTDKTKEIINNYANFPWLKAIHLPKNMGKANALNYALKDVTTKLIITIDADSVLYKDSIRRLIERYLSDPKNTVAVAGAVLVRNSRFNLVTKMQEWDYFHGIASVKRIQSLYGGTLVAQGAFSLYETEEVKNAGGWPNCVGEDIVLTWALLKTGKRIGFAEDACLFTNAPTTWKQFIRQRQRWSRGLFEAFKYHWHLLFKKRMSTAFVLFNVLFPYLDIVYSLAFLPGIVLAFLGYYYIASLMTLLVLPLAMVVNYVMFGIQRRMFSSQGLKVRKNILGFIFYSLLYGIVLQPACVVGYAKELFRTKKTWGTK